MNRNIPRQHRLGRIALAAIVAASPFVTVPSVWPDGANTAHAAETQAALLSREQAIAKALEWITLPDGYTLQSRLEYDPPLSRWYLTWEKGGDARVFVTLDAASGKLLYYSRFTDAPRGEAPSRPVSAEEAQQAAWAFVERVAGEEAKELSRANEYERQVSTGIRQGHAFVYTRLANGLPFLENKITVIVDEAGQVTNFHRDWHEGELPDPQPAVTAEEAERKLKEALKPTLIFKRMDSWLGDYNSPDRGYRLVYQVQPHDAYALDAATGEIITRTGSRAEGETKITPIGTGVRPPSEPAKRITREEAQKIADEIARRFPGSYRSDGNNSSGSSHGPDGIVRRHWGFDYVAEASTADKREGFQLDINDMGELESFRPLDMRPEREREVERPIPYDQAVQAALSFLKIVMPDRLGELYLIQPDSQAAPEKLAEQAKRNGRHLIQLGWLKDGIPLEDAFMRIEVDAESGKVMEFWGRQERDLLHLVRRPETIVDADAAKEAELANKRFALTYFLPAPDWRSGVMEERSPVLAYRFIGGDGVVDAATGEWLEREKLLEGLRPQDIDDHPQRAALLYAVERDLLQVKDGKLEPDKPLSRGELAAMANRLADRLPFHYRFRVSLRDEEVQTPYAFDDLDAKHPQYHAIQQALQYGIFPKEGRRFEPDRPATRLEAAEVAVRLLGYGPLLEKPELFAAAFADVEKSHLPAAALARSLELLPVREGSRFEPNRPLTRAEAAALFMQLERLGEQQ